jgi:cytidyltransferase-like protein
VSIRRYTTTECLYFPHVFCSKMSDDNEAMDSVFEDVEDNPHLQRQRSNSVPLHAFDTRVDKVYTVGCFDLFHRGHITLLQRMKALGKQVSSNHIGCITFPPYFVLPPRLYKSWTLHENNYLPLKTYKLQTNVRRLFSVLTMNIPGEDCSRNMSCTLIYRSTFLLFNRIA